MPRSFRTFFGGQLLGVSPQVLQVIEVMGFRRKYMHNYAAVIQQHPAVAVMAFGAQHVHACAAQLEVRLVCQRAHMGGGIAGCDHEIIRYRGQVFHMQDAAIITFFRVQRAGRTDGKTNTTWRSAFGQTRRAASGGCDRSQPAYSARRCSS